MTEVSEADAKLPAWQRQQKKTFTNWCNLHLRKMKLKVEEIRCDFEDGIALMKLIEAISNESCGKADKVRFRIHKIQNLNKALKKIQECGVKLIGISSEEICDGNLKMILGMIWTLILRFQIQDISMEQMSAKDGLLLWCQKKTHDYDDVNVKNFHVSFKDGLAFCALIHKHRPDLIDYESLSKANAKENLQLAFDVMEKEYDIPQLLDAQDIIEMPKPDEMSVMAYVSLYYHVFNSGKANELAARRVHNLLASQREIEKLKADYESIVTDLLEWIAAQRIIRQDRTSCLSVDQVQERLSDVSTYRKTEKAQRSKQKNDLEDHYRALQTKLRLSNRPAYHPPEGKHVSDVNVEWKALAGDEQSYDNFLRDELMRLQQLEDLYQAFLLKASATERWTEGKEAKAGSTEYGDSYTTVVMLKQQHDGFVSQLQTRSQRPATLQKIASQLEILGQQDIASVTARVNAIVTIFSDLKTMADDRSKKLEEQELLMKRLNDMRLAFAKAADETQGSIEATLEDLSRSVRVHSLSEANDLPATQDVFSKTVASLADSVTSLEAQQEALNNEGVTDNVYTAYTLDEVKKSLIQLQDSLTTRGDSVKNEIQRQENAESLRVAFANVANPFSAYVEQTRAGILTEANTGTLEDQKTALEERSNAIAAKEADYDEVEQATAALEEALVFSNEHTSITMEALRGDWEGLKNSVSKSLSENSNAIEQRDALGLSDEEVSELKNTFEHFDKDKSGALDRLEFRACLMACEVDLPTLANSDDPDPKFDAIMAEVASNEGTASVVLPDFIAFMAKQSKDHDTPEQLLESLRVLAGDKDTITEQDLMKEFSPEDVQALLSQMTPSDKEGEYNYQSFVDSVFGTK